MPVHTRSGSVDPYTSVRNRMRCGPEGNTRLWKTSTWFLVTQCSGRMRPFDHR